jgi:hypothetical protein
MQYETPNYVTDAQRLEQSKPGEAENKLGSAQPDTDPLDAVAGTGPAGMPTEVVAAELRPREGIPAEVLPIETQPTDFMTPETRPRDVRPHGLRPY